MSNLKDYLILPSRAQKEALSNPQTSLVYFRLILKVTTETTVTPKGQKLEAGECIIGFRTLADECGISFKQIRTILKNLEAQELIKVTSQSIGSIVTILAYRKPKTKKTHAIKITKSKEERAKDFKRDIAVYFDEFGRDKEEFKRFFEYWTASNPQDKKLEFETKPTFKYKQRLTTWFNNANKYKAKDSGISKADQTLFDNIRAHQEKYGVPDENGVPRGGWFKPEIDELGNHITGGQ